MSNIELKSSSVNINSHQLCFRNSDFDFGLQTVFRALTSDWRAPQPTDDAHCLAKPMSCPRVTPSHSITDQFAYRPSELTVTNATTSPSIDVENDDSSGDNSMSPVSIPTTQQKVLHSDQRAAILSSTSSQELAQSHAMELTAASVPAGFPLNYQQLYANNAALYGAPVMFTGAIHAAHASYMAGMPLHAALSPNETYLKAMQAAACGMYSSHTAMTPPGNPNLLSCKPPNIHNPPGSMMAVAPSAPVGVSKSHQSVSAEEIEHKNDYSTLSPSNLTSSAAAAAAVSGAARIASNGTGTYLNDKVTDASNDAGKDSHFKVPNGKEGSLKHRLLRPPSGECTETNKTPTMRTYSTTSNFKKGTYIELSNGALRRVEDMRTEDFIQCAERSPQHQLAESTVVKINSSLALTAVITFSYDRNRSKVDMEVSLDHPFFVYGQGWASCSPEMSMKVFGLKCQRLQVGDICISLTKRNTEATSTTTSVTEPANYQRRHSISSVPSPNVNIKSPLNPTPDITYPPHVASHAFSMPVQSNLQHPLTGYAEMAKLMSSYAYAKCLPQLPPEQLKDVILDAGMLQSFPPKMMNAYYQTQIFQFAQQQQQQQQQQEHFRRAELKYNQQCTPPPQTVSSPYCVGANKSQSPSPAETDHNQSHQDSQTHPLDASMSRKRRWSAPENMFDDDESETQPPRNSLIPTSTNRISSPVTART